MYEIGFLESLPGLVPFLDITVVLINHIDTAMLTSRYHVLANTS